MTTQLELKEPKLPEPFEKYVLSKLENGKKGRKHLVNQLGSMDKVLELLTFNSLFEILGWEDINTLRQVYFQFSF